MKKNIVITLLFSVLINQINGAAVLGRRAALAANRFQLSQRNFHSYRDIIGTLSALPEDKKDVSPIHGAVAIASGDLQQWQQQEKRKELFKSFFHERNNVVYPTVALGNPTSSLEPQMLSTFINMTCASSFNMDTFLVSDFVKEWHAVHFKKTGRHEKFKDFKNQVKKITNTLIAADKADQTTALAAATCLKFPTRQELQKVFEGYQETDFSQFQVSERFNHSTLEEAQELLQEDKNYTLTDLEKITFLALESTTKGTNSALSVPFQYANYKGHSIPPCAEVSLRTFINTILIDEQTQLLSLDGLPQGITLNPEFKAFIEEHKDPSLQDYYTKTKDQWMALISGKPTIQYFQGDTEMKCEMDNSVAFLNYCFGTRATTLAEFAKLISTDTKQIIIDEKNEPYGDYNISVKTPDKTFNGQWSFSAGHVSYYLEGTDKIDFSLMDLLRLSKIKKGGVPLLNLVPKNQQRSTFERSANYNLGNPSWTFDALKKTCKILNLDLATFLFEDESNFLHKAIDRKRPDLFEPLVATGVNLEQRNHFGQTPLTAAIAKRNIPMVEALVRLGAHINTGYEKKNQTPLGLAIIENDIPMIEALARLGANLNERCESNYTHLHFAVITKNMPLIEALIKAGADVNTIDKYGFTPLYEAASANNISIVKMLVKGGADVHYKDKFGNDALYEGVGVNNNISIAEILVEAGADINQKNQYGQSLLGMAIYSNNIPMIEGLIRIGANVNQESERIKKSFLEAKRKGDIPMMEILGRLGGNVD